MPNAKLQKLTDVKAIPFSKGKTTTYNDPNAETEPKGVRLAVSAHVKAWIITKRIKGKVKTIRIGEFPDIATVHQAAVKAADMITDAAIKTSGKGSGLNTLNDALNQLRKNSSAKPEQHVYYRKQVERHLSDLFSMKVDTITLDDLEDVLAPHIVEIDGRKLATRTYTSLKQIIRMCFNRAEAVRLIPNPAKGLQDMEAAPKRNKVQMNLKRWPVLDMIDAKKERPRGYVDGLAWELMLFTGLRSINIRELEWDHVDFDENTLIVPRLKSGQEVMFALCSRAVGILKQLHDMHGHQRWVFPHRNVEKVGKHAAGFGKDLVDGDNRVTPHDMRRLFTTAATEAGFDEAKVDQMRGVVRSGMVALYNQSSFKHEEIERVARQIEILCERNPDATVISMSKRIVSNSTLD